MLPTTFEQRLLAASHVIKDCFKRRFEQVCQSDWSFLKGSQKIFSYSEDEAVDGIPIDWFVRGCLRPYEAPAAYRAGIWDVLDMNGIAPFMDYVEDLIAPNFTPKLLVSNNAFPLIITIFVNTACRNIANRLSDMVPTNIDPALSNVVEREHVRKRYRSRSRSRSRSMTSTRSRSRSRRRSRGSKKEKSKRVKKEKSRRSKRSKRSRSRSPARQKSDTLAQDVMIELAKLLTEKKASADPKVLADKLLASITDL